MKSGGDLSASKRIVINHAKKSMMINRPIGSTDLKNSIVGSKSPAKNLASSYTPDSFLEQKDRDSQQRIKKLTEEVKFYKTKNDQSLIKVRFLTQKLQSYGGMQTLPENIAAQISQTDKRIKQLEELLYFKRSKQMKKLKKRIRKFLTVLEYEITDEDLSKIDDEVEMILFLIDVFSDKFNELMGQKNQIDALVENLRDDTVFNRQALEEQLELSKIEKERLNKYLRDMELELVQLRRQNRNPQSTTRYEQRPTNNIKSQRTHDLQLQKQSLKIELQKQRNNIRSLEYQISMLKRRNEQNQMTISSQKNKIHSLKQELETAQGEQNKWRERYRIMQKQKDERIKILESEKYENLTLNENPSNNQLATEQSYGRISFGKPNMMDEAEQEYYEMK